MFRVQRKYGGPLVAHIPNSVNNLWRRHPLFLAKKIHILIDAGINLQIEERKLVRHNESVNVIVAASLQLQTSPDFENLASVMGQKKLDAVNLFLFG